MFRHVVSAFFLLFASINLCDAASISDAKMELREAKPSSLTDVQLYAVTIQCTPIGTLDILQNRFLLWQTDKSLSHLIILTATPPNAAPNAASLPTDALAIVNVFSASRTDKFFNRSCRRDFFVAGGKPLYANAAISFSTSYKPSQMMTVFEGALGLTQPLLTLFGAGALSTTVAPFVTNATAVTKPFETFLSKFNNGENIAEPLSLSVGIQEVRTPYSRVTITIRPLPSLGDRLIKPHPYSE
ncbi:hypothetical protein [Ancylobacter sp.]|uniref:hypothetical protein n=1 Tax=Ancylobacter sp. TaxID=1872567 RepID=UPI003D0F97B4